VETEGVLSASTSVSPKPSFLLNERIFTKLSTEREQLWAIYALSAAGQRAMSQMDILWPTATIFFITNPKFSKSVRGAARSMLKEVLQTRSGDDRKIGADLMVRGLEDWLRQNSEERKDSSAMAVGTASFSLLWGVVTSMLSPGLLEDTSYVSFLHIRLFVIAHHPRLPRHQWSWIDIARKANPDPGQLVAEQSTEFIGVITQNWWPKEKVVTAPNDGINI